jgi:protein ImuB
MLWACLYFSDLPLRAVFEDSEQAMPCAVVDGPRQRPHIVLANTPAQRHGVGAGRVLAASRALCSTLQARTRDRPGEQRLLLSLAAWAYRFSSHVSLCEPDALLVEVGASLRLFGGWPALERRLRRELVAIGHAPAIAVAPLPAAARVLAARHDGFFTSQREPMLSALGCIAIAGSGLDDDTISLLYNVGARTLRDAFALPRPELARRIGPAALAMLDRLRGIDHEVLPLYEPPDRFEHRIELDDRVEAWPPLLFPLRRLCGELALFLAARDGGVQRCDLVLDHEDKPATHVAIELLTPQREARTLYELIRSRLERVALATPVCGIALVATDLPEFRPRHLDLFEPQREQGLEWPELAERLRAHLGDAAVHRLAAAADHRPERAWCFAAVNQVDPRPCSSPPSQKRVRVVREAAAAETLPHVGNAALTAPETPSRSGNATLTPALSRQREREKSEGTVAIAETPSRYTTTAFSEGLPKPGLSPELALSPLPLAGEAALQARMSVAHEAAAAETPPHAGNADLATSEMPPHSRNAGLTTSETPSRSGSDTQPLSRQREREKSSASVDVRPRPLWLLRRALPLRGPSPRILAGPERIESGWWDGGDTRRDYYVVQTREGQRAWAFLVPGTSDGWMLHGWFA